MRRRAPPSSPRRRSPFPSLPYNPAPWVAAGYSATVVEKNTCSAGFADDAADWLLTNAATLTQPTILHTTCPNGIYFKNDGDITLSNNLVVFSSGGVSFKNNASFVSSDGMMKYLYLIQPTGSVTMPCTVDGIDMKNNLDGSPTVSTLFYTPVQHLDEEQHHVLRADVRRRHRRGQDEPDRDLRPAAGLRACLNYTPTYTVDIQFKRETR